MTRVGINVKVAVGLWKATKEWAQSKGLKTGRVVEEALREYFEKRGVPIEDPGLVDFPTGPVRLHLSAEEAQILGMLSRKLRRKRAELLREGFWLMVERETKEAREFREKGRLSPS